jgi:thiamine biosynthesis lipoprotein
VAVAPAARGGRDLTLLPWCGGLPVAVRRAAPGVAGIRLDGRTASVPAGVALDLAGIATAVSARWAADLVARTCGVDVLVEVGGDVAVAGPGRTWRLLGDGRAAGAVLPPGSSLSAVARDAVVDPQTGAVPPGPWSAAVVVHPSCATAKALAVAALVRGADAPRWLDGLGASARLLRDGGPEVDVQGDGSARRGPALAEVSGS